MKDSLEASGCSRDVAVLPVNVGGNSGGYEELKLATGTIVDATIINAPSSTENANKARNREMQQTKNG